MLKINIVYQNKNMPADILAPITAEDQAYTVVWSREVQPGFDVVVYFNHYTYDHKKHQQVCPDALRFLYMYEPTAVDPVQYSRKIWKAFDARLTWNTYLTGSSNAFTFEAGAYYDLPYCSDYGVQPLEEHPDPGKRERAVCQISGDKYSLAADEIYSKRRKVSRWFHEHAQTRMDVFGRPAMDVPNYRGECADKAETFRKYRYALCFENTYHPKWTQGYLTEKILDCMAAQTIPVYYGCSNIEELVPPDCFIDFRRFASNEELDQFLQTMTDEEYLGYAARMRDFHAAYAAAEKHSVYRLYETVAQTALSLDPARPIDYPDDYLAYSTGFGKLRFYAMELLLPHHKFIYPMFAAARSFCKFSK